MSAVSAGEVTSDTVANRSRVTYAGPINSFTLYFASTDGTTAQQIFLTGLTFLPAEVVRFREETPAALAPLVHKLADCLLPHEHLVGFAHPGA